MINKNTFLTAALLATAAMGSSGLAAAAASTVVGFDGGSDGGFTGNVSFEDSNGNPDGNAHFLVSAGGISLRTGGVGETTNPDFLGDYSGFGSVTFSFDVQVNSLTDFIGNEIPREIGISLIDRDIMGPGAAPSGVYTTVDVISAFTHAQWTTLSVTIDDPTQTDLPAGWIGFGAEDPNTFEPILPPGASFATVLAGVDEFQITTFVPGFFFSSANWDVRVDNVAVSTIPVPGALLLFLSGLGVLARRRF